MKNKIILLCIIFICNIVYATPNSLDISKLSNDTSSTKEYQYCIEDKNGTFDFEQIIESKDLKKIDTVNLGYSFSTFWCKLDVHNSSQTNQNFIFYNPRPGMDFIDVKIYKEDGVKILNMGDMRKLQNREIDSIFSNFELSLKANEKITIISKYQTVGSFNIDWSIKDINNFISYSNIIFSLSFLYIGFMFAIMLYKFITFIYLKDKIYFIYGIFIFSAIVTFISNVGVLHYYASEYMDLFTISLLNSIFSHIFLASLWIFTFYFFNIQKRSFFYYVFMLVIFYNIVIICLYIYAYIDISIYKITPIVVLIALLESLLLFVFSFIMLLKKKAGSFLFFIAHFLYVLFIGLYILNLSGHETDPMNSFFISSFGVFLATCFMSLSINSRIKNLKNEHDRIKLEIEKNKQFTIVGATISYVTHQWREPLSKLASKVMYLQVLIDKKPQTLLKDINEDVNKMQNDIKFINNTLSDIKSLFNINKSKKDNFFLIDSLKDIECNFEDIIKVHNINLKIDIKNNIEFYGIKNLFIHALSNILTNSIEAINKNNISGVIKIYNNEKDLLIIEDNAMGINEKSLDTLFDVKQSSKVEGMGIGLNITKVILDKEFDIKISIENINNGVRFVLKNDY